MSKSESTATTSPTAAPKAAKKPTGRKGLKPKNRQLAVKQQGKKLTGNQWRNTPQQNEFMQAWLDPNSETFSNAYQSALKAKYSPYYANQIVARGVGNEWIQEWVERSVMTGDHVMQGLVDLYSNPKSYNNSRSPADTRVKVLELLAKITGILDGKQQTNITIVQPILGGASVPPERTNVVDATPQ